MCAFDLAIFAPVDNPKWEAEDALVDIKRAKDRADAKFKKNESPTLKLAIQALNRVCDGMSFFDRRALIEYLVMEKVGWKKKGKAA